MGGRQIDLSIDRFVLMIRYLLVRITVCRQWCAACCVVAVMAGLIVLEWKLEQYGRVCTMEWVCTRANLVFRSGPPNNLGPCHMR